MILVPAASLDSAVLCHRTPIPDTGNTKVTLQLLNTQPRNDSARKRSASLRILRGEIRILRIDFPEAVLEIQVDREAIESTETDENLDKPANTGIDW